MSLEEKKIMEQKDKFYDYPDCPVPAGKRRSRINIAVVTTGMAVAMSTLYTGSALATVLEFWDGVLAIVIGCGILGVLASLTGYIGAKKGVATAMLARYPFGSKGSHIVGIVLAISMLGWFSYQCGYFGETVHMLLPGHFLTEPKVATFWGGLLMMSTAIVGYKGMTYLSMAAAPLLLGMCIYSGIEAIIQMGFDTVVNAVPSTPASLGVGITIVVGGWITGAVLQPDVSRFAKSGRDNVLGVALAMSIFAVANLGGFIIAKATMAANIMDGLMLLGLGSIALFIVILGQWTSNDNNLYSAALAIINARPGTNKHLVTAICGVIFTVLAITGIQNYFVEFLSLLGTFLPPIAAVLIADFYVLRRGERYVFDGRSERGTAGIKPLAFIAVILGGGAAFLLNFGSTAINSVIIAFLAYLLLEKLLGAKVETATNE